MSGGRLPLQASVRFYRQHPLQAALTLLGIALGAAVIVAVALATRAASVSFDRSLAVLAGPMTHELRAREGALDETIYPKLRVDLGLREIVPLLRVRLEVAGEALDLVGTDPLAILGTPRPPTSVSGNLASLMTSANAILAPAGLAGRLELRAGAVTAAFIGARRVELRPLAVFEASRDDWFGDVLLADVATAQDLSGRRGELDSIQLHLSEEEAQSLAEALPQGVELRAFDERRRTFDDMTRAFRTNLTAMSLLAILVAAFLVYNAMAFAVVQRAPTFAVLRMLGTTPSQLFRRLLLEAAVLGLVGGVLGLLLGLVLGQGLLVLVTQTVSDLYISIEATRPDLSPMQALAALGVTLGAVLTATLVPARDAARTAPAALERESTGLEQAGRVPFFCLGLALVAACPLVLSLSGRSLGAGFVGLFLLIAGYALLCPLLLRLAVRGLLRVARRGGTGLQLALRGVQGALPRTGPAFVALAVAIAATVGVAIMIGSFRFSVETWLDTTLNGDLYVYRDGEGEHLEPPWEARLRILPGVTGVSAARQRRLRLGGEALRVLVLDRGAAATRSFEILAGPADAPSRVLEHGEGILISEPLANRRDLEVGDFLTLGTPQGDAPQRIVGIYRDFASSYGAAILPFAAYAAHWQDRDLSSLAVSLLPGTDAEDLRRRILALGLERGQDLTVVSNQAILQRSLAIFDRTFIITDVLRALVVIVAIVGIVSALMALFLQRRRDFAVLRATGVTPRQLQRLVLLQATTSGLLAGLLALPLGGAMSFLLIDVINRRSFGWTMATQIEPAVLLEALLLAMLAAGLASLWPARRLAGGDLREALYAP